MFRSWKAVLVLILLSLAVKGASHAQSVQGSITGLVADPQGNVVADAEVVAIEVTTNVERKVATNNAGLYAFQDLPPGSYVINISAAGFKRVKSDPIVLVAAASSRFDATLALGSVSEVVEVKSTPPTLITDTTETSDLKTGEDIVREPMQRSLLQLFRLNPGTVSGDSASIMIGGQRNAYENLTIDGITTTNNNFGGQSGAMTADQSFESISDVKIIDGNGSAETPGFTSLITTTKSGTNDFHGSAFYTTDNSAFDSIGFGRTSKTIGPRLQWYGGSVGGPVWLPKVYNGHSKTFFFATWEHRTFPLAAGNTTDFEANLPNQAFAAGNFSSLLPGLQLVDPFTGQPIPDNNFANDPNLKISPVAQALQSSFYPTLPTGSSYTQNYSAFGTSPEHINRYDIRIDHHFTDNDTLSGRFTRQKDISPQNYDEDTPVFYHGSVSAQDNTYISETHAFSPELFNEFRLGYSRDLRQYEPSYDGNSVLQQIGLNLGVPVADGTHGFPSISFNQSSIEPFGELPSALELAQEYSLLDNVSWQKGKHSLKAGVLVRYGKPQTSQGNFVQQFGTFSFGGTGFGTGFDYADFLLGLPYSETLNNDLPNVYLRKTDTGVYAQDSWHATARLTLNYGLRWEYFMPPVDNNDRRANFDPVTGNMVVSSEKTLQYLSPTLPTALTSSIEIAPSGYPGRSLLDGRRTNFGPRLGFAYLVTKNTVVRGGYGIYFGETIQAVQDSLENGGIFGTTITALNSFSGTFPNAVPLFQFPNPFSTLPSAGGSNCVLQCLNVSGTDPHIKAPTSQQWNLTVERDLGHSLVARIAYRGFMTTQLPVTDDLTIPRVFGDPDNYPLYSHVFWTDSGGIQKMNALDVSLERKFTHNLTFQFAYTLAKNLSDDLAGDGGSNEGDAPSDPYNRSADMGNTYYTPRHRMVNNVVWDVPFGRGQKYGSEVSTPVNYILGGWEVAAINVVQSGHFLTPTYDAGPDTPLENDGSPLRPDCNGSLGVSHKSWSEWFNTSAFSIPAPGTYGNCGVGIIQGPGLFGFNLGIYKSFKLTERFKLRFDANMDNAFNHPIISDPQMDLSAGPGHFGTIGVDSSPYIKGGDPNALNSSVSSGSRGARHIWMGLRLDF